MSVLLLHPGEMGSALAGVVQGRGIEVVWSSIGRSASSAMRAADAGLVDGGPLVDAVGQVDLVLSVCPPHAATDVAAEVAATGFGGTYVDANAISPRRMVALASTLSNAQVVDGAILGPPPSPGRRGATRLFLAGDAAADVATLFDATVVEAVVLSGGIGAASALKMAFASWTKGSAALAATAAALADAHGLLDVVIAEWGRRPSLGVDGLVEGLPASAAKAWRWTGEMDEIADACADAGLANGFHRAGAVVWERLASWKDADQPPLYEVLTALRRHGGDTDVSP